jgi:SAM-dependent methyltransferase
MDQRIRNEIAHGAHIAGRAEEVWNWSGTAGRRRWARRVAMLTGLIPDDATVLEVGCGTGLFTRELAGARYQTMSIDISLDLLRQARIRCAGQAGISFAIQNGYSTAIRSDSVDVVVGMSVLHHLDLAAALREFQRVLRPGGRLLFSEPNMLNPIILVQKNIPWVKRRAGDSPDETAFIRWRLGRALRAHGFEVERIEPFDFLHPATPGSAVPAVDRLSRWLEAIPLVREIAGSLFIVARKPSAPSTG